ncbi:MAG: prepilin-type N-terminal cleavage/methylation domain-containing protein [Phycisphaerales bacterium]|nr:prepilin-type N-terminal cleavage/methylation domain-containing protein [Phycisphaerales bacterium]
MRTRRAFTLIELLTVVAIIVTLVGLLLVALSKSAKAAQAASTRNLMSTISRGLAQFHTDTSYFPPTLGFSPGGSASGSSGWLRDLILPPTIVGAPTAPQLLQIQEYYSMTSLMEYLIGPGSRNEDGYGAFGLPALPPADSAGFKEIPTAGIRAPGRDGVWGAYMSPKVSFQARGTVAQRNLPTGVYANYPIQSTVAVLAPANERKLLANVEGRVLGPYLELKDGSSIGAIVGTDALGAPVVARAGDNNWNPSAPKVLLDYYGQPIRYYRRGYSNADPRLVGGKSLGGGSGVPIGWDLSDIFVLRPWVFEPNTEVDGLADANADTATSKELVTAEFALFSAGPNQKASYTARRDGDEFNADNIVEVGH